MAVALSIGGPMSAFAFETVAVSTVSIGGTAATYTDQAADTGGGKRSATALMLSVETNSIRVRWDGTAPTAAVGHLLNPGDTFELYGLGNIKNLRMIRTAAPDASVTITYSRY